METTKDNMTGRVLDLLCPSAKVSAVSSSLLTHW